MRTMKELMRYFIKGALITALFAVALFGLISLAASYPFSAGLIMLTLAFIVISTAIGAAMDDFR